MKAAGIEPVTFRVVAQHLNHCAELLIMPANCRWDLTRRFRGLKFSTCSRKLYYFDRQKDENMRCTALRGKQNRDYAARRKNSIHFLVAGKHKVNF